jgi:hypothetical protein
MEDQLPRMPPRLDKEEAFKLVVKTSELQEVAEGKGLGTQVHDSALAQRRATAPQPGSGSAYTTEHNRGGCRGHARWRRPPWPCTSGERAAAA